jgi:tRNA-splicing ligase RtcB (3'-phosphate/5'-hydroxy nucleic acid ligase)
MANLEKLKTMIPLHDLEQSAQQQIYNTLELDFLKTLAIMPDCHTGYTLPIGGVALLDGVISPEYVGFDIGCGMCCVTTEKKVRKLKPRRLMEIFDTIYELIPVGVGVPRKTPYDNGMEHFISASGNKDLTKRVNQRQYVQIGTLGAGNHFIELGANQEGFLAITIHSGSRNPGHSIAGHYMNLSKNEDKDLPNGFLHYDGEIGQAYAKDLEWALEFALQNRFLMMRNVLEILNITNYKKVMKTLINENHNNATIRQDGILHRKGATPAEKGVLGVIPGTMKSGVYITTGLGNEEYLSSASHGAGRKMSRNQAKKTFVLDQHKNWMKGIVAKVDKSTLDECHGAYKDVTKVIKVQEGVVIDVVDYIKPLINIKG